MKALLVFIPVSNEHPFTRNADCLMSDVLIIIVCVVDVLESHTNLSFSFRTDPVTAMSTLK